MVRSAKFLALFVLVCFISNCGTIIHGSKQDIVITSDPKKANVDIDGQSLGTTPYLARLLRKNKHIIKVQLNGYVPYEVTLDRKLDGWIFGNIIFGGLIGIVIDAATGSMYKLTPKDVNAELKSNLNSFNKNKEGLYIAVTLKPNSNWEKIAQLETAHK